MFTGIVTHLGQISAIERQKTTYFTVKVDSDFLTDLKEGSSIAINGACLTVLDFSVNEFKFQLIPESLDKTAFLDAKIGDQVNLEKALKLNQRLDGHLVQGHVDGVGVVNSFVKQADNWVLSLTLPKEFHKFIAYKGSICLNGVSLTISKKTAIGLEVSLI